MEHPNGTKIRTDNLEYIIYQMISRILFDVEPTVFRLAVTVEMANADLKTASWFNVEFIKVLSDELSGYSLKL